MTNILVLSYNMSWATQINKIAGSEADFVEACQQKFKNGGEGCIDNAISKIGKLPEISLMGIQELNSDLEKKIQKEQPTLSKFERAKFGLASISILWNPQIFGKVIEKYSFNLDSGEKITELLREKD